MLGEALTPVHIERVLRDDHAGRLVNANLEERLMRDVDEEVARAITRSRAWPAKRSISKC